MKPGRRSKPQITVTARKAANAVIRHGEREVGGFRGARRKTSREAIIADMARIHKVSQTLIRQELRKMGK